MLFIGDKLRCALISHCYNPPDLDSIFQVKK